MIPMELQLRCYNKALELAQFNSVRKGMSLISEDTRFGIKYDGSIIPHLHFLEKGTKPHLIRPKDRQALKFELGGNTVFAKLVRHPGSTKHKGFIRRKTKNAIASIINATYNGTLENQQFTGTDDTLMKAIGSVR